MSPERRAALIWLALGPGIWALAEATHAPRLAGMTWAVSGALALSLASRGRRLWPILAVVSLGAATLARVWGGV
ncbi:MAG: hypothetical protein IPN01_20340 [Deltaproteobacteria bacterium]|nr:hypothetical protein [Deltaproteobacteria bacterium]